MFQKSIAVGGLVACALAPYIAHAQSSGTDSLSLQIANAVPADRFFVRAGVIGAKIKTKSGGTYDVTGPVVTKADLQALLNDNGAAIEAYILSKDPVGGSQPTSGRNPTTIAKTIGSTLLGNNTSLVSVKLAIDQMTQANLTALGTPVGIKAVAEEQAMTGGLSLGYYLSDDYSWVVEAFVLAKPIETSVLASGPSTYQTDNTDPSQPITVLRPFGLEGQKIISTKLLPPTVMLGKYWGNKNARFRLYTGAVAMYAMFYDTKATDALNSFVGGGAPGDTTVSLKNTFGMGPMLGAKLQLNNDWHLSFNVGSVKLKTQGTVVTRNTVINYDTPALKEYGRPVDLPGAGSVYDTLQTAERLLSPNTPTNQTSVTANIRQVVANAGGPTAITLGAVNAAKKANGTYTDTFVRKADSTLTSTLFLLSVGRSF